MRRIRAWFAFLNTAGEDSSESLRRRAYAAAWQLDVDGIEAAMNEFNGVEITG